MSETKKRALESAENNMAPVAKRSKLQEVAQKTVESLFLKSQIKEFKTNRKNEMQTELEKQFNLFKERWGDIVRVKELITMVQNHGKSEEEHASDLDALFVCVYPKNAVLCHAELYTAACHILIRYFNITFVELESEVTLFVLDEFSSDAPEKIWNTCVALWAHKVTQPKAWYIQPFWELVRESITGKYTSTFGQKTMKLLRSVLRHEEFPECQAWLNDIEVYRAKKSSNRMELEYREAHMWFERRLSDHMMGGHWLGHDCNWRVSTDPLAFDWKWLRFSLDESDP
jgi:hypothetical protein